MLPKINFDRLLTIDQWTNALVTILDAAVEATADKDSTLRIDLQDLLLTFIKRSPPMVESLDTIARQAIEDLAVAEIDASLERITARSAELTRATGLIKAVTEEAKKDTRTLQLESTLDALAKATAVLADGKLVLLDEEGTLALATATPEKLTVISKASVFQGRSWTAPTLAGTRLYLRDRTAIKAFDIG